MNNRDASYVEFVTTHQDRLRRIAYAVCRDDARAEDVLQEALVKLYLSWGKLREAGREEAYARKIIVNADLDQRRRPWHRRRSELPVEHFDRETSTGPGVEERTDMLLALRQLPTMQRRTVVLRYWLGLSVQETAEELSIREGTVKSHSSRGLEALRALLGESVVSG